MAKNFMFQVTLKKKSSTKCSRPLECGTLAMGAHFLLTVISLFKSHKAWAKNGPMMWLLELYFGALMGKGHVSTFRFTRVTDTQRQGVCPFARVTCVQTSQSYELPAFLPQICHCHSCSGSAKAAVHAEPTIWVNYHVRSNGTVPCGVSWLAMKPGPFCLWKINETVDGWKPANQLIGNLSEYLQGFIHPRWCRISSINRRTEMMKIYSPCRKMMDGRPPKRQYISGV